MATELAVGLSIAQQIMQQQGGVAAAPGARPAGDSSLGIELLSPADAAKALGVSEADVLAIIESGELAAKKIGSSYRIKRSALNEYLSK
jgi:excisionase family DNA binding protein